MLVHLRPFLFVLVAVVAAEIRASAQQFSQPAPLPGDDTVAPSAGNQRRPAIALGANGISLVVWEDDRSSQVDTVFGGQAVGSSVPGNFDIYGVLVDALGQPLLPAPIRICGETWDQLRPRVAWNGSDWLVVFESTEPTQFYYSKGIYAVRVAANGAVLDSTPIRIDDDDNVDEMFPAVASFGGSWLVVWTDTTGGVTVQQSAFVSAAGVVGPQQVLVTGGITSPPTELEMAAASGQFVLTYSIGYGSGVRASRFSPARVQLGATLTLGSATNGVRPAIGTNGIDFYVAWFGGGVPRGTPIDQNGTVAVPAGAPFAMSGNDSECAVGWDGAQWTVAIDASPSVLAVNVLPTGQPTAATTVTTSPRSVDDIAVGDGAGRTIVVWTDRRTTPNSFGIDPDDVFAATVQPTGAGAVTALSVSPPAQINASIAGDAANGFLCVYESRDADVVRFTAHAIDRFGNSLGAPFVVHSGDRAYGGVDVAWNGSEFVVVWGRLMSLASNGTPPQVEGRRCRLDGTLLDAAPFVVMEGAAPCVDAMGGVFLIVARYHHQVLQSNAVIRGRRLDGASGTFLDPAPVVISYGSGGTDVVGLADRWLVAWGSLTAAFVLANGSPQTPFYAADTGSSSTRFRLATNAARDEATVVYQYHSSLVHLTDVHMRRFTLAGVGIDPLLGPVVAAQNQAQLRPTIVALDGEYLTAWADHRDVLDYEPGLGDVFAARSGASGLLLDANGLPLLDTPRAEGGAYLWRTGRGTALLVASAVQDGAFGTHRLQVLHYANAAAAPWATIGSGLAGTLGTPRLDGFGPLTAASAFDLTVTAARPNAIGVLALGLGTLHAPLFGGVLVPTVDATFVGITSPNGGWTFPAVWPAGYSAQSFYAQFWVLDPAAPSGFAASAGLRGLAP